MYDADGNRLIEISNLQQLFFIRHDLNGDGSADASSNDASYALGFPLSGNKKVCDRTCRGYELTRSLDFNDGNSYQLGDVNTIWTEGAGWAAHSGIQSHLRRQWTHYLQPVHGRSPPTKSTLRWPFRLHLQ